MVGKSIYIFGGRSGVDEFEQCVDDLWKFDTETKTWTPIKATGTPPSARSYHSSVSIGNSIYIFGGCASDERKADLHKLDTDTNVWTKLATSEAVGRGGTPLVVSPDQRAIYILGGFYGVEAEDIHKYDVDKDQWTKMDMKLPEALSVALCFPLKDQILLFGGELSPSNRGHAGAGNFSNLTRLFDKNMTSSVVAEGTGPIPRGWSAGGVWKNEAIVMVGGLTGDDENPERLNDVWIGHLE